MSVAGSGAERNESRTCLMKQWRCWHRSGAQPTPTPSRCFFTETVLCISRPLPLDSLPSAGHVLERLRSRGDDRDVLRRFGTVGPSFVVKCEVERIHDMISGGASVVDVVPLGSSATARAAFPLPSRRHVQFVMRQRDKAPGRHLSDEFVGLVRYRLLSTRAASYMKTTLRSSSAEPQHCSTSWATRPTSARQKSKACPGP